jgi:hypothetical protein
MKDVRVTGGIVLSARPASAALSPSIPNSS